MVTEQEKAEIIQEAKEEIIQYIKENLLVEVEGYYEEYSGQHEHYHKVNIEL